MGNYGKGDGGVAKQGRQPGKCWSAFPKRPVFQRYCTKLLHSVRVIPRLAIVGARLFSSFHLHTFNSLLPPIFSFLADSRFVFVQRYVLKYIFLNINYTIFFYIHRYTIDMKIVQISNSWYNKRKVKLHLMNCTVNFFSTYNINSKLSRILSNSISIMKSNLRKKNW